VQRRGFGCPGKQSSTSSVSRLFCISGSLACRVECFTCEALKGGASFLSFLRCGAGSSCAVPGRCGHRGVSRAQRQAYNCLDGSGLWPAAMSGPAPVTLIHSCPGLYSQLACNRQTDSPRYGTVSPGVRLVRTVCAATSQRKQILPPREGGRGRGTTTPRAQLVPAGSVGV
jgi:hypothetical protein